MTLATMFNFETAKMAAGTIWENTILAGTVGSVVHGLNVGKTEDLDIMGVCIEPIEKVVGLHPYEQLIYRTAAQRAAKHPENNVDPHNARSESGDVDMTIYSLRKYLRLALNGNPSILTLLFVPIESLVSCMTPFGNELRARADLIVSKRAGSAFLGYMQSQRQRLLGERGGRHGIRADRINEFGYDSKYAMHILRLAYQGIELMTTGRITLPIPDEQAELMRDVRQGLVPFDYMMTKAGELEQLLKDAIDCSLLPSHPDEKAIEEWMIDAYAQSWKL